MMESIECDESMECDILILNAVLAHKNACHYKVVAKLTQAVGLGVKIKIPWNLLTNSYTTVISELKITLRQLILHQNSGEVLQANVTIYNIVEIADTITTYSYAVLHLIDQYLLSVNDLDKQSMIVCLNLRGNCYRNIAEISTEKTNYTILNSAALAYNMAYEMAKESMEALNPIRIDAALNYCSLANDLLDNTEAAYQIASLELKELGTVEEGEGVNVLPKLHYYVNVRNMKYQNKFSKLWKLNTTKEYIACFPDSSKYLDMVVAVTINRIDVKRRLNRRERNIFHTAFKKLINERRHSLDLIPVVESKKKEEKNKTRLNTTTEQKRLNELKDETEFLCWYAINLLNNLLSIDDTENDSKAHYLRMKGDYYRYLTEISDTTRRDTIRMASNAYKGAYEIAMSTPPISAYQLEVIINYSMFLYYIKDDKDNAASMLRQALRVITNKEGSTSANANLVEHLKKNLYKITAKRTQKNDSVDTSVEKKKKY